jgi:hypothetical protein
MKTAIRFLMKENWISCIKCHPLRIMLLEGMKVTKIKCHCGATLILVKYLMHLEGSLTFRDYYGTCPVCGKENETRDLNEDDITDQEYLF